MAGLNLGVRFIEVFRWLLLLIFALLLEKGAESITFRIAEHSPHPHFDELQIIPPLLHAEAWSKWIWMSHWSYLAGIGQLLITLIIAVRYIICLVDPFERFVGAGDNTNALDNWQQAFSNSLQRIQSDRVLSIIIVMVLFITTVEFLLLFHASTSFRVYEQWLSFLIMLVFWDAIFFFFLLPLPWYWYATFNWGAVRTENRKLAFWKRTADAKFWCWRLCEDIKLRIWKWRRGKELSAHIKKVSFSDDEATDKKRTEDTKPWYWRLCEDTKLRFWKWRRDKKLSADIKKLAFSDDELTEKDAKVAAVRAELTKLRSERRSRLEAIEKKRDFHRADFESEHTSRIQTLQEKRDRRAATLKGFKSAWSDYSPWNGLDLFILTFALGCYGFLYNWSDKLVLVLVIASAGWLFVSVSLKSGDKKSDSRVRWLVAGCALIIGFGVLFYYFEYIKRADFPENKRELFVFVLTMIVLLVNIILSWCNFTSQPLLWSRHLAVLTIEAQRPVTDTENRAPARTA